MHLLPFILHRIKFFLEPMAIDFTFVGLCSLASLRLLLACRSLFQVGLITKHLVPSARNQEAVLFHGCRSIVKCHFYSFWSLPNLPSHVCLNSRGPISSTQKIISALYSHPSGPLLDAPILSLEF